jgi:hypothetical protein
LNQACETPDLRRHCAAQRIAVHIAARGGEEERAVRKARSSREEKRPRQVIADPVSAIRQKVDITAARSSHPHHMVPQLSVYTYVLLLIS